MTVRIRPFAAQDKAAVLRIVRETGFFRPDEVAVAEEVLDAYLAAPGKDYRVSVAVNTSDTVLGYVCCGPTPLTLGTWDLYWIAVDPKQQGRGVGGQLMAFAETDIQAAGGYQVLVETSSQARYGPTRAFYHALGYEVAAQVTDFYAPDDDLVIFRKRLRSL